MLPAIMMVVIVVGTISILHIVLNVCVISQRLVQLDIILLWKMVSAMMRPTTLPAIMMMGIVVDTMSIILNVLNVCVTSYRLVQLDIIL